MGLLLVALIGRPCLAANDIGGSLITFNDNGAWSWFEDERAIVDTSAGAAGKIIVSSVADSAGSSGGTRNGDIDIAALDLQSDNVSRFVLHSGLEADDHDSAALWRRPDGSYLAMYSRHGGDNSTRYRISSTNTAGSIDTWGWSAEQTFTNGAGATYSNLHYLPNDNGGNGRLYNFLRSVNFNPNLLVSYDNDPGPSNDIGSTWAYGGKLLTIGTGGTRPYVKYWSDQTRVHLITTDGHPRDVDNGIYYGYVQNGQLFRSDGSIADANLFDSTGFAPNTLTTVFATGTVVDGVPMRHAWTVDISADAAGNPVAVFQARANNSTLDHRYFYARFNGATWNVNKLAKAGGYLYSAEDDYTGLVALDPSNPNRLFMSTKIDPRSNIDMPHYEIFEGTTANAGLNWTWQPITFNSTMDNIRPIVPKWDASHTALLWMRGTYTSYTSYDLDIVGLTNFVPLSSLVAHATGDLDRDGDIDLVDFSMYLNGLNTNLTGLTTDQAYQKGDLNGDFLNNFNDFVLFHRAYDTSHGEGAFAAALAAVPEPSVGAFLAIAALGPLLIVNRRRRRAGGFAVAPVVVGLCAAVCSPAEALTIAVDIDTTRISASDTSGTLTTQSGFTSWNLTNVGTSGSTITLSGVTFEIFGLAGANQSRIRPAGNGGSFDDLTTDFVFNDGSSAAVGLRISGLSVGTYDMQSWHYDSTLNNASEFVQVEVRNQGQSSPPPVVDNFAFSNSPASFQVPVTASGQVKEIVFREDSATNRSRLNGFTLTLPEPVELTLEVNTTSGAMRIINEQGFSFDMNYYEIRSPNGSLMPTGWVSFDDTDGGADPTGSGWDQAPASDSKLLNEVNLESKLTFAPGDVASFGTAFITGATLDIEFSYAGPDDAVLRTGIVKYVFGASGVAGDYNNNGIVDMADYVVWRKGGVLQNEGRSSGVADEQDYNFWKARFGASSAGSGLSFIDASSVPEAPAMMLVLVALTAVCVGRRNPI